MSGQKWAHLTIRKLWKIAWDIWDHRNQEAHKHDTQLEMDNLLRQAQNEIEIGARGQQDLQHFLSQEEQYKVLRGNAQYIQCWLRSVQARRSREHRRQQTSSDFSRMRHTLRQFLTTK